MSTETGNVCIYFNPQEDVKSADAVTYDDEGKVIPLSERFNAKNDDIRYSMRGENWKPTLDKVEWRIVNYAIENKTGKELTETTDYFSAKKKGKRCSAFTARMIPRCFMPCMEKELIRNTIL